MNSTVGRRNLRNAMVRKKITIHKRNNTLISSGLIGVGVIAIVQISSINPLSKSLLVAVFCFSISIPFLAAMLWVLAQLTDDMKAPLTGYFRTLYSFGFIFSFAGIAAVFFHFHYVVGIIFLVSSILAVVCAVVFLTRFSQTLN